MTGFHTTHLEDGISRIDGLPCKNIVPNRRAQRGSTPRQRARIKLFTDRKNREFHQRDRFDKNGRLIISA